MRKSRVFIGSSNEGKYLAQAIQLGLQDEADPELWSQGIFRLGEVPLETLLRVPEEFDFAVFLFSPDDVKTMREQTKPAVRDNVLFELGLFLGRLGRERSFFVRPRNEDLHLPSDLKGITSAEYDRGVNNAQKAVSSACFQIITAIKSLGPIHRPSSILFDSELSSAAHFRGKQSKIYKSGKAASEQAAGEMRIDRDGVLQIDRSNAGGKYEIQLRPRGPDNPSFTKRHNPPPRVLHITCEARVEGGTHDLRFVAKDEKHDKWLANEIRTVKSSDWTKIDCYLWVKSTLDFLLRIDDENLTEAPSSLFIRKLSVTEESS